VGFTSLNPTFSSFPVLLPAPPVLLVELLAQVTAPVPQDVPTGYAASQTPASSSPPARCGVCTWGVCAKAANAQRFLVSKQRNIRIGA